MLRAHCCVCEGGPQAAESGFKKRGSIAVSKVDANGYYYLNIAGEVGHRIRAVLQVGPSDVNERMQACLRI